jgi:acetoin utilization protein AcuB
MRLQEVMSTPVETITKDTSVAEARTAMKRAGIHHLVVGRGKSLIGVISSHDISRALATDPVSEWMSGKPLAVTSRTTVREAANLLRGRNIGCLPVVEGDELVGIVTISDLLELLGRGAERPSPQSTRWTLKSRGPRKSVPGPGRQGLQYHR